MFILFTQNSNNNPTLPLQALLSPTQPIPSLDDFFESLDNEFEQLGINKIGWRK
ncbi:2490_t:CDS:2, partial [Rhizophagus irregularis]